MTDEMDATYVKYTFPKRQADITMLISWILPAAFTARSSFPRHQFGGHILSCVPARFKATRRLADVDCWTMQGAFVSPTDVIEQTSFREILVSISMGLIKLRLALWFLRPPQKLSAQRRACTGAVNPSSSYSQLFRRMHQ